MEPGTGGWWHCTLVTQFLFDSITTGSLSAHVAEHRFHLQLLCLSAGVQRVLVLGKTLGVVIALGVQPLCQLCQGRQCLQGLWGLWGSLSAVLGCNQGLLGAPAAAGGSEQPGLSSFPSLLSKASPFLCISRKPL